MNPGWRPPCLFARLAILRRQNQIIPRRFSLKPKTSHHRRVSLSPPLSRCFHARADSSNRPLEDIYHPEADVEDLEDYVPGGYHPTLIGNTFSSGRYTVVHKLGFGGYSTIWLAWDEQRRRYVSLKILTARASPDSHEGHVLHYLMNSNLTRAGKRFIPPLLDQFWFHGPNGHHQCLVAEPAGGSIAKSKEDSTNFMFPPNAARSTAAKLLLGLSYLHANGICHGGEHISAVYLELLIPHTNYKQISICATFSYAYLMTWTV